MLRRIIRCQVSISRGQKTDDRKQRTEDKGEGSAPSICHLSSGFCPLNKDVIFNNFGRLSGKGIPARLDILNNLGGGLIPFGYAFGEHSLDDPNTAGRGFRRCFLERHVF
jgi:hypothetical protein